MSGSAMEVSRSQTITETPEKESVLLEGGVVPARGRGCGFQTVAARTLGLVFITLRASCVTQWLTVQ